MECACLPPWALSVIVRPVEEIDAAKRRGVERMGAMSIWHWRIIDLTLNVRTKSGNCTGIKTNGPERQFSTLPAWANFHPIAPSGNTVRISGMPDRCPSNWRRSTSDDPENATDPQYCFFICRQSPQFDRESASGVKKALLLRVWFKSANMPA